MPRLVDSENTWYDDKKLLVVVILPLNYSIEGIVYPTIVTESSSKSRLNRNQAIVINHTEQFDAKP